jgi:two-component system response regulator HydG
MIELFCEKLLEKEKTTYKTNSSLITIGRDSINDLVFDDSRVSLHHAAIIKSQKGHYFVRDLGSLHGIQVNGQSYIRRTLHPADTITILGFQIHVEKITQDSDEGKNKPCNAFPVSSIEIPVVDIEEIPATLHNKILDDSFGKTCIDPAIFNNSASDFSSGLAELLKLSEFKTLIGQFLSEICKQIFRTKTGYVALFDAHKKLLLTHKVGISDSLIPPIPKKIYYAVVEEGTPVFMEISDNLRVACAPLKDAEGLIGLIYIYNIPKDAYTEDNKQNVVSVLENHQFQKHISKCFAKQKFQDIHTIKNEFKWGEKFIGYKKSGLMQPIYEKIDLLSKSDIHVILLGEKGSGKTNLARLIHDLSKPRSRNNFVTVDLNAIPANLVESELFGTVRGAFSGAVDRAGYFEFANGGTIFLDEIGDLSLDVQSKIRAVLDTKTIRRVGSLKEILLDIRIIAATNKNLDLLMSEDKFRGDLYDRLGGRFSTIELPPLRERRDDVVLLANYFVDELEADKHIEGISRGVIKTLSNYDWPGNVRTLRDIIRLSSDIAHSEDRQIISASDLPSYLTENRLSGATEINPPRFPSLEDVEKNQIVKALEQAKWNKRIACELLGITRPTLDMKMKKYEICKK